MQITQLTYRQTISYKPFHSITIEAVADIEPEDDRDNACEELQGWIAEKIHEYADKETGGDRPKSSNFDAF